METFQKILDMVGFTEYIQPLASIFVISLGISYMCMIFDIAGTKKSRHKVAAITVILSSFLFCADNGLEFLPEWLKPLLFLVGSGMILYTILGKDLYSRMDNFLDNKLGDNGNNGDAYLTKYEVEMKKKEIEKRLQEAGSNMPLRISGRPKSHDIKRESRKKLVRIDEEK